MLATLKCVGNPAIMRYLLLTMFCAQSVAGRYYYYPILLFDLVYQKPKLQNVLKAITLPMENLTWTFIVGIIIMYEYAMIAFYSFRQDFHQQCETVVECISFTVYQGLRQDIGATLREVDSESENFYERMVYDLSFFMVLTTLFMNILAGMVIDQFGALRDATAQREEYMKNKAFVSCLDRSEVDKIANQKDVDLEGCGSGFDFLETKRQNRWNYLNFIFYLKRKDAVEYTGPEKRIAELVAEEDTTWLPLLRCRMMEDEATTGEEAGLNEDPAIQAVNAQLVKIEKEQHEQRGFLADFIGEWKKRNQQEDEAKAARETVVPKSRFGR